MVKEDRTYYMIRELFVASDRASRLIGPEWDTKDEAVTSLADPVTFPPNQASVYKPVKIIECDA